MTTQPATTLTDDQLRHLSALVEKMTPGPWMPEKSWSTVQCPDVHWSIRTVNTMPEHPWSARYIAWVNGTLRNGDTVGASDVPYRYCDACKHGYYRSREAGVEVRVDEQVEADVQALVALRNSAPALLATIEAAKAVARVYFDLAAEVIGEDEVRRQRDEMIARAAQRERGDGA